MNEQIKELAEQAGCKVMDDGEWYIPSATGLEKIVYTKGIGLEKFAELIVRECARVLEANSDNQRTIRMTESTGHNKTTDWMEGYEEAVKQYGGYLLKKNAKQIKQHFGVEE